jgi:hypothetical protein
VVFPRRSVCSCGPGAVDESGPAGRIRMHVSVRDNSADVLDAEAPGRSGLREAALSVGGLAVRPALRAGRAWWGMSRQALDAATLAAVEAVLDSRTAGQVVDRVTARVLRGPELERVVEAALASPAVERALARVIESQLVDRTVTELLQSEQLWRLVEEIARSPAVTDAITRQSMGFADQVADGVRTRSRDADAWLERVAWRVVGRRRPA